MVIRSLPILAAVLILVGCGNEPEQSAKQPSPPPTVEADTAGAPEGDAVVRDVQYFIDNPDERRAVRDRCRNDPGALEDTQDCVNADEANSEARRRSTRERLGG